MVSFTNAKISKASVEVWRSGSGKQILFLHPGDGIESSIPLLESLSQRYEVIAPSHPGFGGSELPDGFTSVDDLAYFYLDLVRQLRIKESAILVGVSFGAWIAAQIAVKSCRAFESMILVGPLGAKFQDPATREITDLFSVPQYDQVRLLHADERTISYADWPEEALLRMARNHISFALFGWSPTLYDPKLRQRLGLIQIPTLVVVGEKDRVVTTGYCQSFAAAIPGGSCSVVKGAGHYAHVDAQASFEAVLNAFVDREKRVD